MDTSKLFLRKQANVLQMDAFLQPQIELILLKAINVSNIDNLFIDFFVFLNLSIRELQGGPNVDGS